MRENKGITLVVLIVTIIILLILAGITMAILTNTGLLRKSKKAEQENNVSQVIENLKLKVMEVQTEKNGNASLKDFVEYLSQDKNEEYIISLTKTANIQGEIPDLTNANEIYVTNKSVECKIDKFLSVEYSKTIELKNEDNPVVNGCSRYIDVKVKRGPKMFTLSVDIPDSDKVEKIQYYVDDKKVYEGIEKTHIVDGLQPGKEYTIYAIVTYSNEKISKKIVAIDLPQADIYVSKNGNDTTGNGEAENPYASLKKAIEVATDGQKIYIEEGEYELDKITRDSEDEIGIWDQNKKIEIFGDNQNTILKFNATKTTKRDGPAISLSNKDSIVRNLTYIYEPKSGDNYQRAIFESVYGNVENVFFRVIGNNYASCLYSNSGLSSNSNIVNCSFFYDKDGISDNYSGYNNFKNMATNVYTKTNGNKTNMVVKKFGSIEDSIKELIEKSKNDSDFNTKQAGVFYGEHAWEK